MQTGKFRRGALMKASLLLIFIVAAVLIVRFSGLSELLTVEKLRTLLAAAGIWAPLAFVLIYALGVCLFIPATLLTALGAAIFGPYWGFLYVWVGAMLGAAGAFLIGRYLGREFAASLIGDQLKKYDAALERNGFATVLYLRLVFSPFTPMNFGMGLTRVRYRDYLWGTGLGILTETFIITFCVGAVREVWATGHWANLLTWKIFFSLGLFFFSLLIPKTFNRLKFWQGLKIG
ncbi:MAG: TVP38/TMEM64 family protein [Desulfobaccales bacterium]